MQQTSHNASPMKTSRFSPELLLKAQAIKVVFFDVDGVMTDGGLLFTEQGETIKRFNTLDGFGIKLLQKAGITPVVISGRDSVPLRARLKALGIVHIHLNTEDKRPAAEKTLAELGLTWQQVACMGDDWPDLPVMQAGRFACAPLHAHVEVKAVAHYITETPAGRGAVREFCDLLITASGHYAKLLQEFQPLLSHKDTGNSGKVAL
jgi:3-deoxy-D-manno-octulosonate 8-phosphate phosphatase (KDO 8-P phosphatase)